MVLPVLSTSSPVASIVPAASVTSDRLLIVPVPEIVLLTFSSTSVPAAPVISAVLAVSTTLPVASPVSVRGPGSTTSLELLLICSVPPVVSVIAAALISSVPPVVANSVPLVLRTLLSISSVLPAPVASSNPPALLMVLPVLSTSSPVASIVPAASLTSDRLLIVPVPEIVLLTFSGTSVPAAPVISAVLAVSTTLPVPSPVSVR